MSPNRKRQLELCKEMLKTLKNIFSYDFLKGINEDPFAVITLIFFILLFSLADLIRMSFDPEYPPKPEWQNVNGKISMLN